ncbi:MAG: flavodoxin family protein [Dehalococcoidales bacterium]|nr:flavodoxin family protein [Dehalococcoidales bacterium]
MKVIGICCSPRKGGNTEALIQIALESARAEGAETELVTLADKKISFCDGCYSCHKTGHCHIKDDIEPLYDKMWQADGIIFGTPVYFWNVTGQAKTLIDRTFAYSREKNLWNKPAGAILVHGSYGSTAALAAIYNFFAGHKMVIVGNAVGVGRDRGAVKSDAKGMANAAALGKTVVRYLKTGKIV